MGTTAGRKAEQSQATRSALVAAARELFATRGYAATATEEIVQAAGVSRGALYHHFEGKEQLFRAVYEELQGELVRKILAAADAANARDPLERLRAACQGCLDAFAERDMQRIVVLEAATVLDWNAGHEIRERYGFGLMRGALQAGIQAGAIEAESAETLAHVIHGALYEGAIVIVRSGGADAVRHQVGATIDRLLAGLRPRAG